MRDLAGALGHIGVPVSICTAQVKSRDSLEEFFEGTRWHAVPGSLGRVSWSPQLGRVLDREIRAADIVHNHSVWTLPNSYASRIAKQHGKPVLFTPHGSFEPWALAHSRWKKRLAASLFQDRELNNAACIQVVSQWEAKSIRAYGLNSPVAVIPNGVNLGQYERLPARAAFDEIFPELADRRICLFMSRLHKKKGLAHLIPAWRENAKLFREWQLVIAGPDDGYERIARRLIADLDITSRVTLVGPLVGERKAAALAAASIFALPSFSEGFSMAVLEAMAARLPVLITPGCNFPEAVHASAGIQVEPTEADTARGLNDLLRLSDGERAAMGRNGRELVERHYTWDRIANQMLALYEWIVTGGLPPAFVQA